MGCFNSKGFISGLSIKYNDPVVCIIGEFNRKFQANKYYSVDQIRPWMLPIFGEYDDYGCIEDIEPTVASNILEKVTGLEDDELDDFFKLITEIRGSDKDLFDALKRSPIEDESEVKIHKFLERYNKIGTNLTLLIEHKDIYEDLVKSPNHTKFFSEFCDFNSKIYKIAKHVPRIFGYTSVIDFWNNEELINEYDRLQKTYECNFDMYFFNWHSGLGFYNTLTDYNFWGEPGFAEELSRLQAFDIKLLELGLGYNTPFGCGSQSDTGEDIIEFYKRCISFYENKLSV